MLFFDTLGLSKSFVIIVQGVMSCYTYMWTFTKIIQNIVIETSENPDLKTSKQKSDYFYPASL